MVRGTLFRGKGLHRLLLEKVGGQVPPWPPVPTPLAERNDKRKNEKGKSITSKYSKITCFLTHRRTRMKALERSIGIESASKSNLLF